MPCIVPQPACTHPCSKCELAGQVQDHTQHAQHHMIHTRNAAQGGPFQGTWQTLPWQLCAVYLWNQACWGLTTCELRPSTGSAATSLRCGPKHPRTERCLCHCEGPRILVIACLYPQLHKAATATP